MTSEPIQPSLDSRLPAADATHAERFTFIDALRGMAALSVAIYHIDRYGPLREPATEAIPGWIRNLAEHGWVGVQIFFVISGFVIAYSLRNARITPAFLANYALRRSIRLDPPYWITIFCVLALNAFTVWLEAIPSPLDEHPTWPQLILHFFYLQNLMSYDNLSAGFWTLCIEMQFYLLMLFLLGIAQRLPWGKGATAERVGAANLLICFAPLALLSLFGVGMEFSCFGYLIDTESESLIIHFFCMFFAGALAWWALDGRIPQAVFVAFIAAMAVRINLNWSLDIWVAAVAALAIFVTGRLGHLQDWLNYAWLQYLGRISYSLYLIHYPVSHVIVNLGYRLTGDDPVPAVLWTVLAVLCSLAAAHLLYMFVEAPSVKLASRFKVHARHSLALEAT